MIDKDKEIEKLVHMNQRLLLIVGYAASFVCDTPIHNNSDKLKYDWLMQAIENLVYLDKPLPRMP
jgi:hypothetical protein